MKKLGSCILIILILSKCSAQSISIKECNASYRNASKMIVMYSNSYNKDYLKFAINSLDTSQVCESTKAKSIKLKISIYFLLKDYKSGELFLNSLSEETFDRPYKKKMYRDIFKASQLQTLGDTVESRIIYSNLDKYMQTYLKNSITGEIDKDACYAWVLIKAKYKAESIIYE